MVLTVTDNQGATGTVTHTVTAVANVEAGGGVQSSVNNLVVSFNGFGVE